MRAVRVAYVAGAGRSGSTLLDCMLGQIPGVFSAGEVTHLWKRGGVEDQLCGCSQPFSRCEFWTEVIREAFGGPDGADFQAMSGLRDRVCGLSNLPRLTIPGLRTRSFSQDREEYAKALLTVYTAILAVSGCGIVVDSSKYPPEAYLLRSMEEVDLTLLHIVRDPNAVAFAWQKRKILPEVHWEERHYARYRYLTSAVGWRFFNALLERMKGKGTPYELVRYEDLIQEPASTLSRAASGMGLVNPDLSFVAPTEVSLAPNHTVSGNAARFRHGVVPLRLDSEWREKASRFQRAAVGLLTWPTGRRYGYL